MNISGRDLWWGMVILFVSVIALFSFVNFNANTTERLYIEHNYTKVTLPGYDYPVWVRGE